MNIVFELLSKFFNEEQMNFIMMISISFIINILQTNGITFITANIINFIEKNNRTNVLLFFKFFVVISVMFIILHIFYKYFQNKLLTKLRQWIRFQLVKVMLLVNNENFSEINFTKLNSPINRISSVSFMIFNDIITFIVPNITFLMIIYKNYI